MARDYGNRRSTKRNSAPNQLLVIVVTFVLGYFTATIMDIQKLSQWINKEILADSTPITHPAKVAEPKKHNVPKPKFEFYTLLANEKAGIQANNRQDHTKPAAQQSNTNQQQVVNNAITATTTGSVKAVTNNLKPVQVTEARPVDNHRSTSRGGSFMVQVASFKTKQDADNMKAKLTLKGFDVSVIPVSNARGNWFRVVVGPFPDKAAAQVAQVNLSRNERLNGMITSIGG